MKEPLISVIIPAYNAEKRLNRCLESVCGQSWKPLEILVINDGSTDRTGEIARSWSDKDARVRLINQKNTGVAGARNHGLELCRGEWIRFVDADDKLPSDSIRNLYERVEKNGSDLVIAGYEQQVGELVRKYNLAGRDDTVSCDEYLAFLNRYANSFFCGVLWNKLFRRNLVEQLHIRFRGGLSYGEDFCFVCDYLKGTERISFSTATVYRYIRHAHSMTVGQTVDSVIHPIRNLKVKWYLYQVMKELYCDRGQYAKYQKTMWQYMIRVTLEQ